MVDFPRSLIEFQRRFPDERAWVAYLARLRWPDGFRCPSCGHAKGWELASRVFTWGECAGCARQTSVTAGTVMHASKLSLTVWFWAASLMATHSNGIAALQLQAQDRTSRPGCSPPSCAGRWLLRDAPRLAALVEVDETTIPLRRKDQPPEGGHGRSHQGKMLVAAGVEVHDGGPGRVRLGTNQDASAESLHAFVGALLEAGTTARTDGWSGYPGAPGITHEPHVVGPMAAQVVLPWTHRVFANFKLSALGVYHGLRRKHLQSDPGLGPAKPPRLDEFAFRFNRRHTRHAAFPPLLGIAVAKMPTTYNMLIIPEATA